MNTPHPDIDELAELAEELLPSSRAHEVETHLSGCSDCTQLLTAVQAVPAQLADVPSPPLPPETAARLDSALQAEAARRTADAAPDSDNGTRPVAATPIAERRRAATWGERHPRLRVATAAAATVAVLGGGVALIGSQGLSTGGSAGSTSAQDEAQMDSSVPDEAAGGQAESAPARDPYAAELDAVARRLRSRQSAGGAEVGPALTAAAASVHGLRVGMAAS